MDRPWIDRGSTVDRPWIDRGSTVEIDRGSTVEIDRGSTVEIDRGDRPWGPTVETDHGTSLEPRAWGGVARSVRVLGDGWWLWSVSEGDDEPSLVADVASTFG